ncbi:MAG TPA: CheR family methyltransferase [Polyangiales bacterium]|nr:CheR family methyltransferase [Polyangiales bacterium]
MLEASDSEIEALLEAIYTGYHHDFRGYALASLRRRLGYAMLRLDCNSLAELRARLDREPTTFTELLQHLTVQVSDLFRDPRFFLVMREQVVPILRTYPLLRIWVAGCSTGEELYSLAILLDEEGLLERSTLYATDINPHALRKAEAGIYALDRLPAFTENHRASGGKGSLSRYYTAAYGSAVFDRALRKQVVFADHSLATDSVFAEVQVVCCRNVIIYFDRTLQDRALGLMKESLCRRGFLGLGSRESLQFSSQRNAFSSLVSDERWYQRL